MSRRLLFVGASVLMPLVAHASGFALLEQSTSKLGTAFAGSAATADDASTIYFNPAGLTQLHRYEVAVLATEIDVSSKFRNANSTAAFGQPLGGSGGDAGGWNFVPAAYFAAPLTENLVAGFGVNAPFGLKLVYDDGWIGRFQALRSEIETLNFNPSLAYRINDRLSFGVGVNYQRLDAELTNAVNYSAVVAQGVQQLVASGQLPPAAAPAIIAANAGLEGRARVRGDDTSWGFNVGLTFDVTPATRIGVSYRSAIDYNVSGTISFRQPTAAEPVGAAIVAAAGAPGGPLSTSAASVDLKVPDSALLSVRQKLSEQWTVLADVQWTGWSTVQELRIVRDSGATVSITPERWEDVWRYALGATYSPNDSLTLRAGVAYDQTPVPDDTRTPRLPDSDRTWVALGTHWQLSPQWLVDFGYAHLFSDTVPLNQSEGNAAAFGVLSGKQHSDINIFSLQTSYRF